MNNKLPKRVRTPTILQMESVECGAASLGIILAYYHRIVPLVELRQMCDVSRDGSKASNILKAARHYGMEAKGFKKQISQLEEMSPPYIVFWNFNHFVVVEGFGKERVYLNDPATGPRTVTFNEFDQSYTGVVLVLEPGESFTPQGHKPSLIDALSDRLKNSQSPLFYSFLASLLLVIPGLAIPVFSQILIDEILLQQRQSWLHPLLLVGFLTIIIQAILTLLQRRMLRQLKIKLSISMSSQFVWHILRLPAQFYAQRFAGEISNRVHLNDRVADILSTQLTTNTIDIFMVIFYALVMFTYDGILTLISIIFAIINIIILQLVSRPRQDAYLRLSQDQGKIAGISIAALQSIETLKASALESDFFARWAGYFSKTVNTQQSLEMTNLSITVFPNLLFNLNTAIILIVGGLQVMEGQISIGMLIGFQLLMQNFQEPITNLVQFASQLQQLEGDLNRLDDVLNNPIDTQVKNSDSLVVYPHYNFRLRGHLELNNITFGYSPTVEPLITNFSCIVQPGKRLALVGCSGSGKSTIAKLITGLYQPWEGKILFDGQPRTVIPRAVMTNSMAMVEQEIFLFGGTVRDNLSLWDETIPTSQLIHACKDAAIWDTVLSIPGGLDGNLLEGGANLSGGQRQRLEIARSLAIDPAILVMDEATSALDAETEQTINNNLRRRGCTCVIIAHRLSTIRDCDEIIVLASGKIVERGTHQELWQQEGVYRRSIQAEVD
ncbi:NHLP family bacteriocin export ABC transporter peptidase/permease/ATPase subunit [Cronbergia sp. UHCC 0137]|uniref:NHLP family bacteriocin export ABC transporter peptidase/permease/ATPase subunit n=1 Tax=Cronbergia sp. UHCC 0137 TaxID=3110239 RepID=UPI002B219974|nr:NHLP family bacteriocin export ABC transporter peptidase/permease/ATPase subunit [Cronbergia sp. UHCC 0137]MEA5618752.1 NHLP family bacteriocin export ABC transporter peptidase/permease/ATPase subunit [Cronbergia sp. UHCC 0137]